MASPAVIRVYRMGVGPHYKTPWRAWATWEGDEGQKPGMNREGKTELGAIRSLQRALRQRRIEMVAVDEGSNPTRRQIKERTVEIQKGWDEETEQERSVSEEPEPWTVPVYRAEESHDSRQPTIFERVE